MKTSEFLRLAKRHAWRFLRQGKGSHEVWEKDNIQVIIPNHPAKELPNGLEKSLKTDGFVKITDRAKKRYHLWKRS